MLPQLLKWHVPHCCFAKVVCIMLPQLLKWHVLHFHIAETASAMLLQLLKQLMLHPRIAEAARATLSLAAEAACTAQLQLLKWKWHVPHCHIAEAACAKLPWLPKQHAEWHAPCCHSC